MFKQLRSIFRQMMHEGSDGSAVDTPSLNLAMACLLCEVSNADHNDDPREKSANIHQLMHLLGITEDSAIALLNQAQAQTQQSVSLYEFTTKLRSLQPAERYSLIEAMWEVAYADGILDPLEEAVIRQVAELVYVDHAEFIRAKLAAQNNQPAAE
ncbi:TerB family tellurite resistance protein [Photobacterium japonica]|uniref:tellurite resistance TerB family protein n=1 Tax=Photobacterium japonica TaxID=2910235 RepID=UPI003D0B463F